MTDLTAAMKDLLAAEGTEADARVQAWRDVLMGVQLAGFREGYAACAADATVRAALSYSGRYAAAKPGGDGPAPADGRPADPVSSGYNGGPADNRSSTLMQ